MYLSKSLFFIIIAVFAVLMVLILITLLTKHRDIKNSVQLNRLKYSIICFCLINALYFTCSDKSNVWACFQWGYISNILDTILFPCWVFSWGMYMKTLFPQQYKRPILYQILCCVFIIIALVSIAACFCFEREGYHTENDIKKIILIVIEILFTVISGLFITVHGIMAVSSMKAGETKAYAVIVSIAIGLYCMYSEIITIIFMLGVYERRMAAIYHDITYFVMIFIATVTLVYLFRHDFSPIYFREDKQVRVFTEQEIIDRLADECCMTKREREIAHMIFAGESYESIADKLYISKYTVKKHVHNFYGKLEVDSRMNLINKVRNEKRALEAK